MQEDITFLCAQSPIVPHPSGWVFGVKAIHSSPIRIPFHQFASNQVTNSPSKEMGRIREGFGKFLFLTQLENFPFQTLVKDLKLADGVSNVIYFILRLVLEQYW